MTLWTLIFRSLRFHARAHIGVVLGAVIGSAALVGALVVGDSVRGSLREQALMRLAGTDLALNAGDRFVRDQLADDLARTELRNAAPVLQLAGTAANSDGTARANRVQVLGIDERLKRIQPAAPAFTSSNGSEVIINRAFAEQLKVKPGDSILLRVQKPSALSREAPISPQQDFSLALRLTVTAIAQDEEFGRFDLQSSQLPPLNAFVPLQLLQQKLELTNRANLLLVRNPHVHAPNLQLRERWQPADSELEIVKREGGTEVRSRRVFIDPPIASAILANDSSGILTYFVNELRAGTNFTPYSMVTGTDVLPKDLRDDEILITQWLAEDLQAKPGDQLQLKYFVMGGMQRLIEKTNTFRVREVVPMQMPFADRSLMPDFPGLAKAEKTENWDAGFPIQMSKIRPKDEQYWKEHRGTPKAFVTLAAAQSMWSNRFGALTAIRFSDEVDLMSAFYPEQIGLKFERVRYIALAASASAQDFGGLFLGFSFFLILAALILMGLLFQFGLEQRASETGTLLALGFRPKQVRRIFLGEALLLAIIGGVIGTFAGMAYARAMLTGLTTIWSKAVGGSSLHFHVEPQTLAIGLVSSVIVALLAIALVLRKQGKRPARELLFERGGVESEMPAAKRSKGVWIATISLLVALGLIGTSIARGDLANAGIFFGAGVLLLIAGLAWAAAFLRKLLCGGQRNAENLARFTLSGLGVRNSTRRRKRSLATMALLACGSFIVVAVGANRLDANKDAWERSSGTGGFALIGESSLPVVHDLNNADGRNFYGLNPQEVEGVSFVPMRVKEGDDASCLNLNRAQTPRLLGVNPDLLFDRQAFSFAKVDEQLMEEGGWKHLNRRRKDGAIPAIGDYNSILWAMHKKVGDTIDYVDEHGQSFKVKIVGAVANSILQGNLLISEKNFIERFPGASGYRMFLVDAPSNSVTQTAAVLTRALQDVGLQLTPAAQHLDAFNAVQNTYLNTFQVLGGLGLLIGSAGLGVVVLRNVLERRGELALLRAVGFRRRALRWMVLSEHAGLLVGGLAIGLVAAIISIIPSFASANSPLPGASLVLTIGAVLVTGLIWVWLAVGIALRGELLDALRSE